MEVFSISDLENLTGVKAHTIRIWEQRYNIVNPKRTETNIRYYTNQDLRKLLNVSLLNMYGVKISHIAKMSENELNASVLEIEEGDAPIGNELNSLLMSMFDFDEHSFKNTLTMSIGKRGVENTMYDIIFPLMKRIGTLWQAGSITVAYEHFVSNIIRNWILIETEKVKMVKLRQEAKKFILFLPENENHEIGLLFANYIIKSFSHCSLYLGQAVPTSDLISVLDKYDADYLLCSSTSGIRSKESQDYIYSLSSKFSHKQILFSGAAFEFPNLVYPKNTRILKEFKVLEQLCK
ncbi:MAG TPA: MerR family transcriptional regulator [Bacteroidia bacterium]|nr:MerR family transcriptional regulator [Bacteroidia bacterium]HNT79249.1 MerR family transcriptional regulator [Bacteroidia bacterium]